MKTTELDKELMPRLLAGLAKNRGRLAEVFGDGETPFSEWLGRQPESEKARVEKHLLEVVERFESGSDRLPRLPYIVGETKKPDKKPDVPKGRVDPRDVARVNPGTRSEPVATRQSAGKDPADALRDAIAAIAYQSKGVDEDRVKSIVEDILKDNHPARIEIAGANLPEPHKVDGVMHRQVTQVAQWVACDVPVWAWGGAGGGKSTFFYHVADCLGYGERRRLVSMGPTTTASTLIGFCTAGDGSYREGLLYQPYKEGWLAGIDEPATGDPGVIAQLNAMVANGHYTFPNGETVERHPEFRLVCLDNTKGTGATAGYTARTRLDAATLDRFAVIEVGYDEALETLIATGAGEPGTPWKGRKPGDYPDDCVAYVQWVQAVRKHVGKSVLVSPRASILGCKAIRAGIPVEEVKEALVYKLTTPDTKANIEREVR
jgi:hypothetical protein